jgi:hypothetical protein
MEYSQMKKIGLLHLGIIILTVTTAIIHLTLGIPNGLTMFILNGIGYLILVTALYLPQLRDQKKYIRWVLILYTAITILGWVFVGARNTIGYLDKLAEITLIVLLIIESRTPTHTGQVS